MPEGDTVWLAGRRLFYGEGIYQPHLALRPQGLLIVQRFKHHPQHKLRRGHPLTKCSASVCPWLDHRVRLQILAHVICLLNFILLLGL